VGVDDPSDDRHSEAAAGFGAVALGEPGFEDPFPQSWRDSVPVVLYVEPGFEGADADLDAGFRATLVVCRAVLSPAIGRAVLDGIPKQVLEQRPQSLAVGPDLAVAVDRE
jgi:hypothetical protein